MVFYKLINMSDTGYRQSVENKSMKIETLQKIAEVLNVPISVFFEETESVNPNNQTLLGPEAEMDTPAPWDAAGTEYIMELDLPDTEKIRMLRELVSLQQQQILMLQNLAAIRKQTIDKLKGEKDTSV